MAQRHDELLTVGWREWVSLPELGIPAIKAKIDTGAKTSALHAHRLAVFEDHGQTMVRFAIRPLRKRRRLEIECVARVADRRLVRDSGGHSEHRYVIVTPVRVGQIEWPIEITLTSRDTMLFRFLLGRTAMRRRMLIDPEASYVLGKTLAKSYPRR